MIIESLIAISLTSGQVLLTPVLLDSKTCEANYQLPDYLKPEVTRRYVQNQTCKTYKITNLPDGEPLYPAPPVLSFD